MRQRFCVEEAAFFAGIARVGILRTVRIEDSAVVIRNRVSTGTACPLAFSHALDHAAAVLNQATKQHPGLSFRQHARLAAAVARRQSGSQLETSVTANPRARHT